MEENNMKIVSRVNELANCKMSQIALALLYKKEVAALIVGATKEKYIVEAFQAQDIELSDEDTTYLEEEYIPHPLTSVITQ